MDISSEYIPARTVPMQDILSSLRDAIATQGVPGQKHEPTPTEYFAAIVSVLKEGNIEHLEAFLQIFAAVIPKTNQAIVQSQFKVISLVMIDIMRAYTDNTQVLKNAIEIIGSFSCAADMSEGFWSKPDALRAINALFACIDDDRTAVRKASCQQIRSILLLHKTKNCRSARSYASDFCSEVFKQCTRSNYKRSLYVVMFLEESLATLMDADVVSLFAALVRLIECEQPILTAAVYRTIDCLFQSNALTIPPEAVTGNLKALLQLQGRSADMQANTLFYSSLCSGVLSVQKRSPTALTAPILSDFVNCFIFGCETDISEIHCAIGNALKRIMNVFISVPAVFSSAKKDKKTSPELMQRVQFFAEHLAHLLTPRFQNSWLYIMDSVRFFFERINITMSMPERQQVALIRSLGPLIKGLSGVVSMISTGMLKVSPGADAALEVALAGSLSSLCGPINFVKVLMPIETRVFETGDELSIDQQSAFISTILRNKVWLVRFLKRHMKSMACSLDDFAMHVLPMIEYVKGQSTNGSTAEAVETLWALFPEFCASYDSRDIAIAIPRLIGTISSAVDRYCRSRQSSTNDVNPLIEVSPIFLGLTNAANIVLSRCDPATVFSPPSSDFSVLSSYAQVVLPMLITFLEVSELNDKLYQTGIHCLEAWSGLSPPNLLGNISKKMLQLLLMTSAVQPGVTKSSDSDGVVAAKYMSIVLAIIPKISPSMVQLLYRTIKPLLSVNEIVTVQKRSYLVLRALLTDRPRDLFEKEAPRDVLSMLGESFLLCHVSARSMRLECMELVIRAIDNDQQTDQTSFTDVCHMILGEVLISQKDSNGKCRLAAVSVLKCLIMRVPPMDMLIDLCSAVAGETPSMRSSAIGGLALLLQLRKKTDPGLFNTVFQLLPSVSLLLLQNNIEETRSILSLYRVLVTSAPPELLMNLLEDILRQTLGTTPAMKSKFMKKSRKIVRKALDRFGSVVIGPMIPESDAGLLAYLQRLERRQERKKSGKSTTASVFEEEDMGYSDNDDSGSEISAFNGTQGGALSTRGRADSVDELTEMVNQHYANNQSSSSDYRLDKRQKATFAGMSDLGRNGSSTGYLPMSLDDLMEDQGPSKRDARSRRGTSVLSVAQPASRKRSRETADTASVMDVQSETAGRRGKPSAATSSEPMEKYNVRFDDSGILVVEENDDMPPPSDDRGADDEITTKDNHMARAAAVGDQKKTKIAHEPGEEYRSKRASGDVWKRGMLEPHAYVPLDGRLLAKTNTANAIAHFGSLMKGSKGIKKKLINTKHNMLSRNAKRAQAKHASGPKR